MKAEKQGMHHSMHPKSEETEFIKKVLKVMSDSRVECEDNRQKIDFELAALKLENDSDENTLAITENFCNLYSFNATVDNHIILCDVLSNFYGLLERLKSVKKGGKIYYDIITRYCINKEFADVDDATLSLHMSVTDFHRKKREAYKELGYIWFIEKKNILARTARSISTQLNNMVPEKKSFF